MAVTVRIPTPLQRLTNGKGEVSCEGKTVSELLADLEGRHPGIKERICDQDGKLRRFVNIFVNEEDIRFLQGDQTAVNDGDEISIIPAIAGGGVLISNRACINHETVPIFHRKKAENGDSPRS